MAAAVVVVVEQEQEQEQEEREGWEPVQLGTQPEEADLDPGVLVLSGWRRPTRWWATIASSTRLAAALLLPSSRAITP